jgi:hypothetical protein
LQDASGAGKRSDALARQLQMRDRRQLQFENLLDGVHSVAFIAMCHADRAHFTNCARRSCFLTIED